MSQPNIEIAEPFIPIAEPCLHVELTVSFLWSGINQFGGLYGLWQISGCVAVRVLLYSHLIVKMRHVLIISTV